MAEHCDIAFLTRAIKFAADKHRDQKRKDNQTPYINHPIEVMDILARVAKTSDSSVLAAAILHDTIEDTETSKEELRTEFGDEVLSLVMECTDDKSLPKAERKRLQIETAAQKSDKAKLVKIADKISNLRSIMYSPPPDWKMETRKNYVQWCHDVWLGLRGVNAELDRLFEATVEEARRSVESAETQEV
jgi:guanosine-3',5'-bis(diphosphate) 3'-pyrophosphohydrolase